MTFQKYLTQWLIVTVVFAGLAFLTNMVAPTRTLWPFGVSFLYLGVLILLTAKMIIDGGGKKE
ncbi:MAG: hypothetical protein ACE5HS_10125 [bacterium]